MSGHGHEAEEGGAARSREPFPGRSLPLNSKKLTSLLLQRLARRLDVPDAAPPEELRQAIKDKLSEMGHEPKTVQVCLQETGHGIRIGLQDAEGIFYDIAPEDPDGDPSHEEDRPEESVAGSAEDDLGTLRKTLKEVSKQKGALQARPELIIRK